MMAMGVLLIAFGVIVVFIPQILIAMVATVLIVTGLLMCATSWQWRRLRRRRDGTIVEWFLRF